jgi:2,4'-dihydroxyacetophenone dioxygenase
MTVTSSLEIVRHVGEDNAPWVDAGNGVELKLVRFDRMAGTWVIRNRFQPGARLQIHRHTGPVDGFTLSGRWHYLEYDFYSTAGSYIYEPAGSVHTLDVPSDNRDSTDVLFVIEGALLNLDPQGNVESAVDGEGVLQAYYALLEAAGQPRPNGLIV